jgi:hypothetical protein
MNFSLQHQLDWLSICGVDKIGGDISGTGAIKEVWQGTGGRKVDQPLLCRTLPKE